ncbi:hypothetical protein B0H10DRAFT_1962214 [Mycena sp. CBHHK59/15]|nr:hypothetical protein B0H10DRAFT_1962214 [Mycena sp. CBHHK59/15]
MSSASVKIPRRRTSLKRSKPSAIPIPVGILVVNGVSVLLGRLITWSSHYMAGGARRDEDDARQAPVLPRTCRPWYNEQLRLIRAAPDFGLRGGTSAAGGVLVDARGRGARYRGLSPQNWHWRCSCGLELSKLFRDARIRGGILVDEKLNFKMQAEAAATKELKVLLACNCLTRPAFGLGLPTVTVNTIYGTVAGDRKP